MHPTITTRASTIILMSAPNNEKAIGRQSGCGLVAAGRGLGVVGLGGGLLLEGGADCVSLDRAFATAFAAAAAPAFTAC